ncbi:MAG TPA: hypothetical protein VI112_15480 [Bacteroidia bacterium]|jgi:hypothetical protein
MAKKNDKKEKFNIRQSGNYITLTLGGESAAEVSAKSSDSKSIANLLSLLTNKENKQLKEDALRELKSEAGKELLLKAIAVSKDKNEMRILTAACWEAGLDFSKYLSFFVKLALISDLDIDIEVLTVIEDMQGPFDKKMLEESMDKLSAAQKENDSERSIIFGEMVAALDRFRE